MEEEYSVILNRYDDDGSLYSSREEGRFVLSGGKVSKLSGALDDTLKEGDTVADVKRKLKPPYFSLRRTN